MKTRNNLLNRALALFLSLTILLGVMPFTGLLASGAGAVSTSIADKKTVENWKNWFSADSNRFSGGVYIDKSVYTASEAVADNSYFKDIKDKLSIGKDNFGNENFLVSLSAIGSNTEIVGYSATPTDTMIVLDLSNSMSADNSRAIVKSTNRAIETLQKLNRHNRIGVVLYSGSASQNSASGTSTATVILPLGRYSTTVFETKSENGQNVTHEVYFSYSNDYISLAAEYTGGYNNRRQTKGVTAEGDTDYITGSKQVNGGTYIQNGLYKALNAFAQGNDTVISDDEIQGGTQRMPIIVLMSDGAPTTATTNYANVGTANAGEGLTSHATNSVGFLTQLTAAWVKAKMKDRYNGAEPLFYTLGVGTSNNAVATGVLNPSSTANGASGLWTDFLADNSVNLTLPSPPGVQADNFSATITAADNAVLSRNYVNKYWSADGADDMIDAFDEIVEEIIIQSRYYSTLVTTNDHENDGFISFTDEIGSYMEVKEIKGIHLGEGSLVTGGMFAEFAVTGQISTEPNLTADELNEIRNEIFSALSTRFGITATEAYQLVQIAFNNGDISYNASTGEFSNVVSWYADQNNDYISPYNKIERAAVPQNAKYIVRSYIYLGDVTQNHAETSMMYMLVRVREDIQTGRQIVDGNLPAALLPMVNYHIEVEGKQLTANNITSMTSNIDSVAPICLLFEVGLDDQINPYNIAEKLEGQDFRKVDGKYEFYTNRWRNDTGAAFTVPQIDESKVESIAYNHGVVGSTETHFVPSVQNERYYYTSDTDVYVNTGTAQNPNYVLYTGNNKPTGDGYYHIYQFVVKENNGYTLETVYNPITAAAIADARADGNGWEIPAGTPKRYYFADTEFGHIHKDNVDEHYEFGGATHTLHWANYQSTTYLPLQGDEGYHIFTYLGNNGKITATPAQGIKLTKTVTEAVDGAPDSFTFNISFTTGNLESEYNYRLQKANGDVREGTVDVENNAIEVTISNGDTIYIADLPHDAQYEVTEVYNPYYVSSSANASGTIAQYTLNSVDFVNSPRRHGSLLVEKDVIHPYGEENLPDDFISQEYEITVQFAGDTNDINEIEAPQTATKQAYNKYTLMLKDGHDALFTNIPENVTYTVSENLSGLNGFELKTAPADLTGTIQRDTESKALLVNEYKHSPVSPAITLKGTKDVPDRNDTTTEFEIALQQVNIGGSGSTNIGESIIIDAIKDGESYSFNMGSQISFDKVGTYSYMVYEVEPTTGKPADLAYDKSFALFSIIVTDDDVDGALEIKNENIVIHRESAQKAADGSEITKNFTNIYEAATVSVNMKKTVNGSVDHAHDSGILFGLFDDDSKTGANDTPLYYALTDNDGKATISFNIVKNDYPTAKYYYVREVSPAVHDRVIGMTYDSAFRYVIGVSWTGVSPEVKYYKYNASAADGIGDEFANTETLVINNTYDNTDKLAFDLGGQKTLDGRGWKDNEEFTFELYSVDADFSTVGHTAVRQTKATKNNQSILFDDITFSRTGTAYLVVKEIAGNAGGMTYDATEYHITANIIKAEDNSGKTVLAFDPNRPMHIHKVGHGDAGADQINFTNAYTIEDTEKVKIYGEKKLTGRNMIAGEFTFELYEGSVLIESVTNAADGSFAFTEFTYTEPQTHSYVVKEKIPSEKYGVGYDTNTYTVVVEITDDGNGKLNRSVKVNGSTVTETAVIDGVEAAKVDTVFNNSYSATGTELKLSGTKTLDGRAWKPTDVFTFELYEVSDDSFVIPDSAVPVTTQNKADKTFEFNLSYEDGDEGIYYYVVSEHIPTTDKKGISYDTREYHITVMVVDNGEGELEAAVTGVVCSGMIGSFTKDTLNFGNSYNSAPVKYTFTAEKTYDKAMTDGMFEFELYRDTELLQTVGNKADGSITFSPVELNFVGTHTFTVKEVRGSDNTVKYDDTVYTVEIKVEDNTEGSLVVTEVKVNGTVDGDIEFKNSYISQSVKNIITAKKTLSGRTLGNEEFEFELYAADSGFNRNGAALQTVKNQANGEIRFAETTYDKADTYYYVVAEKNNGVANITYDTATYGVEVKVEKNQNLDFEVTEVKYTKIGQSGKVDEITFANTYTPPTEPQKEPASPKTGDNTNVLLWIALLFTTGGITAGLTAGCKKRINK